MKRIMAVMLSMALAGSVIVAQAQQGTTTATTAKSPRKKMVAKKAGPTVSDQLSDMKQAIDAQQQQIKQLSDLVQSRDQKIQQLEQRLDQSQAVATQAQTKADTAVAQTAEQQQTVTGAQERCHRLEDKRHQLRADSARNSEAYRGPGESARPPLQGNNDYPRRIHGGRICVSHSGVGVGR